MTASWFVSDDLDGRPTFGAFFGDSSRGGCLLWRPFEPVAFSDDPAGDELTRAGWLWSGRPAADMGEALELARELADTRAAARAYRERATRAGSTGREARRADPVTRARAWMQRQPAALAGDGGDRQLFAVALGLVRGFKLEPDGAAGLLLEEYDARSEPPWGEKKRRAVLVYVEAHGRRPWGYLLDAPAPARPGRGAGRGRP